MHLLYKEIEYISPKLCYFPKSVTLKLCSAEPSLTGNSQGFHQHISFVLKLVKIILIIF